MDFPAEEEIVLQRWKEIDAFRRQVELSKDNKPWSFSDGPPFATGKPHYGHLLASTIKDIGMQGLTLSPESANWWL
jgi:isoleucyl-tRNA synthetase